MNGVLANLTLDGLITLTLVCGLVSQCASCWGIETGPPLAFRPSEYNAPAEPELANGLEAYASREAIFRVSEARHSK